MRSKIVITSDFEALKEEILGLYGVNSVRFFFVEDFLLENAKEVAAEAYIAESEPKLLVLGAKNFRVEAQNSLLKIIEEPPKNIFFIIACEFIDEKSALERSEKFGKNDLKELIAAIALEATAQGFKFSAEELEYFFKAVRLADLNTKTHALLTPILLMIYEKGLR